MAQELDLDELRATYDHPTDRSVIELIDLLEQAEQAIARVRELHSYGKLIYPNDEEEHLCSYDENSWPCETIRALDGNTCD